MTIGHSKLGGMLQGEKNQLTGCVKLLLLWVAASDGTVDDSELEFASTHFPGIDGTVKTSALLEVLRNRDLDSIETAIRTVVKQSRELRSHFLEMAITMSMADREIAIVENHILRFYADALYLGAGMLEKRFQAITGTALTLPGDPGSPDWWARVAGGDTAGADSGPVIRDLYARLAVKPGASTADLAAALEAHPDLDRHSEVLLDPERRKVYDATHSTLQMIGILRNRLGLDTGHSWFLDNCPDFAPRSATATFPKSSRPAGGQQKSPQAGSATAPVTAPAVPAKRGKPRRRRRLSPLAVAAVAIVLVALAIAYFLAR